MNPPFIVIESCASSAAMSIVVTSVIPWDLLFSDLLRCVPGGVVSMGSAGQGGFAVG